MLNTRDLEERWLKYKIKSYIPYATIALSSIVIIIVVSIFLNSNKVEKKTTLSPEIKVEKEVQQVKIKTILTKATEAIEKTPPTKEAIQIQKTTVEEVPKTIAIVSQGNSIKRQEASLKLSPSLDFMKKMQHSSLPYYQEESAIEQESRSQIVEEVEELEIEENTDTTVVEEEPKKITIQRRDSADDIRGIIKRFKKNNNPALSLFIAKKYYELGEYHKAYNYALITNEINSDIDASWIVSTKSLVKLNQKDMAIQTLKQYIEDSHSSSAKILLDEIISGKFR
ncbi:MAG: hypothetical protein J7K14_01790 [Sulfurimonas sp.]|nr:hypothetical protein [Sulfurimonas sp.]